MTAESIEESLRALAEVLAHELGEAEPIVPTTQAASSPDTGAHSATAAPTGRGRHDR